MDHGVRIYNDGDALRISGIASYLVFSSHKTAAEPSISKVVGSLQKDVVIQLNNAFRISSFDPQSHQRCGMSVPLPNRSRLLQPFVE